MTYKFSILFSLLVFFAADSVAQDRNVGIVFFDQVDITENDGIMSIDLMVRFDNVVLKSQDLMIVTPVLQERGGGREVVFQPVAIAGKARYKAVERSLLLHNYKFGKEPSAYIMRKKGENQAIPFRADIPFEEWMRDGNLTFTQMVTGCRDCPPCYTEYRVAYKLPDPVIPDVPVMPRFELAMVTPEAEPVKRRSESYQAHLNFLVGKHDLIRDFADNAAILDEIDSIVGEVMNDEDLTFELLQLVGYASPEGNFDSNMKLSQNRALALVDYLSKKHNISSSMIAVEWKGEDWDGLRRVVRESDLRYRSEIVDIIDENENIAVRKRKLQALKGGAVYRELLKDYYPALRRNEYTISFVARAFDIEEARKLIKTKPQYLSLNEMFLVANSYPKDSDEFREVFDIAVRMFPDNETARINNAAQEIEMGLYDRAARRLDGVEAPDAWNNLAVIYARQGKPELAEFYFVKAVTGGSATASENLGLLKDYLQALKEYNDTYLK